MTRVVCFPFVGDSIGGAHLSALELIRHLDRRVFTPLIVLHQEGVLGEHLRREGVDFTIMPLPAYAGTVPRISAIARSALRSTPKLVSFLRKKKVALVHANDLRMNLTWLFAARLAGAKFVWHQRTTVLSKSLLWRLVPTMASHCIAISKASACPFGKQGSRLSVIDNPFEQHVVNRRVCRVALLEETGADPDELLIGFVGRLVATKRPDVAVSALGLLHKRCKLPVRLLLFGRAPKPMRKCLAEKAQAQGVSHRIHFMDFRFPIEPALAGLDLLISPSEQEGFGRTLVEAMLVGTPIVASSIPAHLEILDAEENALLARAGDGVAFAKQAERLLTNKEFAAALAEAALHSSKLRYSAKGHAAAVQSIYGRVFGGSGGVH